MFVEFSKLLWVQLLLDYSRVVGHVEHVHAQVSRLVVRFIQHLDGVDAVITSILAASAVVSVLDVLPSSGTV